MTKKAEKKKGFWDWFFTDPNKKEDKGGLKISYIIIILVVLAIGYGIGHDNGYKDGYNNAHNEPRFNLNNETYTAEGLKIKCNDVINDYNKLYLEYQQQSQKVTIYQNGLLSCGIDFHNLLN